MARPLCPRYLRDCTECRRAFVVGTLVRAPSVGRLGQCDPSSTRCRFAHGLLPCCRSPEMRKFSFRRNRSFCLRVCGYYPFGGVRVVRCARRQPNRLAVALSRYARRMYSRRFRLSIEEKAGVCRRTTVRFCSARCIDAGSRCFSPDFAVLFAVLSALSSRRCKGEGERSIANPMGVRCMSAMHRRCALGRRIAGRPLVDRW